MYSSTEVRDLSCCEIISPHAYDTLGNALPSGCYDPRLGPVSKDDGSCVTCGMTYENCPGHIGHVELCVPAYNPLVFGELNRMLKAKCMNCHKYRGGGYKSRVAEAKIRLVEKGRVKEALAMDD
ncbi:hypothetical protein TrRE_jg342, partial [Triparma retinervis]